MKDHMLRENDEDRLDRIEDEREVVRGSDQRDEVIGEDRGLDQRDDDLVMGQVEADRGLGHDPAVLTGQAEEVTGRHLHSTKPEKLVLRGLSSAISLHVVKLRDHREVIIGGKSRRNCEF